MRKEIAFMCLSENCELERLKDNNIKLTLTADKTREYFSTLNIGTNELKIPGLFCIEFDPEDEVYEFQFIDDVNHEVCYLSLDCKDRYLKVTETEEECGYIIKVCDINKFDKYPQYRMEIKDDKIITYCISRMYMDEFVLLNTPYTQENILEHKRIQNFMGPILEVIYNNDDPTCKFYAYYRDMIYSIDSINTNIMKMSSVDVYGNFENSDQIAVTYGDFVNVEGFIFNSNMIFVYHNNLIKDGMLIGTVDALQPILYDNSSVSYKKSTLLILSEKLSSLNDILELMYETNNYELIKYIDETVEYIEELNGIIKSNEFLHSLDCNTIITSIRGKILLHDYNIIDNIIFKVKEQLNIIRENMKNQEDDNFDEILGLSHL